METKHIKQKDFMRKTTEFILYQKIGSDSRDSLFEKEIY